MDTLFADVIRRLEAMHADYFTCLDDLSSEQLDWVPGIEMNSLCVLAVHVTAAERFWIGIAIDDVIERDRPGRVPSERLFAGRTEGALFREYQFLQGCLRFAVSGSTE